MAQEALGSGSVRWYSQALQGGGEKGLLTDSVGKENRKWYGERQEEEYYREELDRRKTRSIVDVRVRKMNIRVRKMNRSINNLLKVKSVRWHSV